MLNECNTNLNHTASLVHPDSQLAPTVNNTHNTTDKYTLYIGDSMIKHIKSSKMTSSSQKAAVFSYPGATISKIQSNLAKDNAFIELDPAKVETVFVLGGTNNIDRLLNIPFHLNSSFIDQNIYKLSENNLGQTKNEFDQLSSYLRNRFQAAKINYVNILPRVSSVRNHAINILNEHIKTMTSSLPNFGIVSTELTRNLFVSRDGYRKDIYFSSMGEDNVHLNDSGVVRLAKHLKYIAHNSIV